jgi:hypothetical protein
MIRLVLILALISQSSALNACLHADQNRIFPIGQSSKGMHVLELQQARFDEDFKPIWSCIAYHNIYNRKHEIIHSDSIGMYVFPEFEHNKIYEFFFNAALNKVKKEAGVTYVKPKSLYFCDFTHQSPEALLSFDTINNKVFVQLISGKKHEITTLGEQSFLETDLLSIRMDENDESTNFAKVFQDILCINSVRKFTIGNKQLTIIHLAIGEFLSDADGNIPEPKPHFSKFPFNTLITSLFFEPVLHHGYGFDFMIWE